MDPLAEVFAAVEVGDAGKVEELLGSRPDLVNARSPNGDSLLLAAAYRGKRPVFELLLARGAAVSLFEASALGLADRASARLDEDPDLVNSYSHDGWTPLHLAAFFGREEVARLLLERGADVNARSRSERFARANTPLHAAAANSQTAVAEMLIARGADVNAQDGHGFTPLALAANSRNDLLVILLLEKGAQAV
jgi:ankyrin repeat protein